MRIGAISFQPYVYNVNAISPASMNKLSRISDDVLDKKTDYSGLTGAENENPLKMGQTLDFQSMLAMQMQRGRNNAARVMKPAEEETQAQGAAREQAAEQTQDAAVTFEREEKAQPAQIQPAQAAENMQTADMGAQSGNAAGSDITNFRMQQAINAYEMFMTA